MTVYDELAGRHHQDTAMCVATPVPLPQDCPRPTSQVGVTELKQNLRIEIIVDASGSMAAAIEGQTKFEIAKGALTRFVATFPTHAQVALRVYGHVGSNQENDKARSCAASDLVLPFTPVDQANIQDALDTVQPSGWTPVAGSLALAASDFASVDPATTTTFVYLVSDGIETCDGDPVNAARTLHATPSQAVVSVIGFDVEQAPAQQLRAIAMEGGGSYYEARNTTELEQVFQQAIDWEGWKQYYYCTGRRWHVYATQVFKAEDERHECVRRVTAVESQAIRSEVESNPQYGTVRKQVLQHASAVRQERIKRSNDEREAKIAAANAQARQEQSDADLQRQLGLPPATETSTP